MTLTRGARLGPYEIVDCVGAGGMGEVYKARDTRLGRTVAIKVLPAYVAADEGRRARLESEARVISRLNHPHICVLHDIGHEDGIDYLVMEYLEGQTLARRLEAGPMSRQELLRYGIEIADALARAHKQGIVHRDLKPANVMLTKSGAKLLDFGLAKFEAAVASPSGPSDGSTVTRFLTEEGTLVGTVQYMAPEQLHGKSPDHRCDIWALGCVLYETATGRRPFSGDTTASLIAAILRSEPPSISTVQPLIPPALDRLVRNCLAKDPEERWQSAQDLANELRWVAESGSAVSRPSSPPSKHRDRLVAALIGAVAMGVAAGSLAWTAARARPPAQVMRFAVPLRVRPELSQPSVALSHDGSRLVFSVSGTEPLYIRALDQVEPTPISGTEGASAPFFSPDGQWIGFFARGTLRKVHLHGGAPMTLCEAVNPRGATWGPDDSIVFAPGEATGLYRVGARGGRPHAITTLDAARQERSHRWPAFLPDGKTVLFTVGSGGGLIDTAAISAVLLATGERREVLRAGTFPRYFGGYLLFGRTGTLLAARFDHSRLTVTGHPIPVIEKILTGTSSLTAHYATSVTGTLAYPTAPPVSTGGHELAWVDRSGRTEPTGLPVRGYYTPVLSPDGKRVAVMISEGDPGDVWVGDLMRGTLRRVTFTQDSETAAWMPDGKRIVYGSGLPSLGRAIVRRPVDADDAEETLLTGDHHLHVNSISSDGRSLVYSDFGPRGEDLADIGVLPLDAGVGERKSRLLVQGPFSDRGARLSPDGRWLAYTSDESGRDEVYVQAYPGPGSKLQVSTEGGGQPVWARNGRQLFYRSGDKHMSVPMTTVSTFSTQPPRALFSMPFAHVNAARGDAAYDVSPDGQRFLFIRQVDPALASGAQINVVLNWSVELARRLGSKTLP